jgi:hypothetical protein
MVFSVLFLLLGSHEKKMGFFAIDWRSSMRGERKETDLNCAFVPAAEKFQQEAIKFAVFGR